MRDLSLAISPSFSKTKSKSSVSAYRLNLAIIVSSAILGFVYLFIVSSLGTKGYDIRKLEQQVVSLQAEQKILQTQASDLQSIQHIKSEVQQLNFVPATNVTYLKESDFALR
jgi:hypothetical protein